MKPVPPPLFRPKSIHPRHCDDAVVARAEIRQRWRGLYAFGAK